MFRTEFACFLDFYFTLQPADFCGKHFHEITFTPFKILLIFHLITFQKTFVSVLTMLLCNHTTNKYKSSKKHTVTDKNIAYFKTFFISLPLIYVFLIAKYIKYKITKY